MDKLLHVSVLCGNDFLSKPQCHINHVEYCSTANRCNKCNYTASINCPKKNSVATNTQLRILELLTAKTPLLHMLYYMNWLTHDFWTRTGGWEFDRSHGAGTSSPSSWQQVEEQAPKPVGWMMCFLLMTFVPVQKLCVGGKGLIVWWYVAFLH